MSNSPNQTAANDEAIEARAASWLVQKDEGFTPGQAAEFARWRNADPRHAAAVATLEETCGILGKLPLLRMDPRLDPASAGGSSGSGEGGRDDARAPVHAGGARIFSFPTALKYAAAIAACLTVAAAVWWLRPARESFSATYVTSADGRQHVDLPDKSVIELNAATEIRVQFTASARRVTLARGEAHFTVAKNPARPFLVGASNVAVRAVGTAFNVRLDSTTVEVIVTEGRVQVSQAASSPALLLAPGDATTATLVDAGQRVVVSRETATRLAPRVTAVDSAAVRDALAWQAPRLVFVDTPLFEVVQQFNRHNRVQLEIGDPGLGERAVGGTFRADNVETFVRLLQDSRDIAVERTDAGHIVLRRVAPAR